MSYQYTVNELRVNNTIRNKDTLLSLNRKALQGLHYFKGYDFTKPFDVISGDGKFTLNSIKKECEHYCIDTKDVTAVLFVKPTKQACFYKELHIVDMPNMLKFNPILSNKEVRSYIYNFDTFYAIKSFEEYRKEKTEKWFVVIQKNAFMTADHKENILDGMDRMCVDSNDKRYIWQDGIRYNSMNYRDYRGHNMVCAADKSLDKSGYSLLVYGSALEQRLNAYKTDKRKKEADGFDGKEIIKELDEKFRELKTVVLALINADEVKKVAKVMWKYEWMYNAVEKFKKNMSNNNYSSIDSIKYAIDQINGYYNDITNIVNGTEV